MDRDGASGGIADDEDAMALLEDHARSVFFAALERSREQWPSFLSDACGEDAALRARVDQLLRAHQSMGSIDGGGNSATDAGDERPLSEGPGSVIGPYKLLSLLGEGGFGVVFLAEQTEPLRREVALKVLKPGMDTRQVVARFDAERQALAILDHPNIARIFDGGATASGRPFFVMQMEQVRRELLEDALGFYQAFLAEQGDNPKLQRQAALALGRVGGIYRLLGRTIEAKDSLSASIQKLDKLFRETPIDAQAQFDLANFHAQLGSTLAELGQHDDAVQSHRRALAEMEKLQSEPDETRRYRRALASLCTGLGYALVADQPAEAEGLFRRAIDLIGPVDDASGQVASAYNGIAWLHVCAKRWSEAEKQLNTALGVWNSLAAKHPSKSWYREGVASSLWALATVYIDSGRLPEAQARLEDALAVYQRLADEYPTMPFPRASKAACHATLGRILAAQDRSKAAEHLRKALKTYESLVREFPTAPAYASGLLGNYTDAGRLLAAIGHTREAEQALNQAVAFQLSQEQHSSDKLKYWCGLAISQIELGRLLAGTDREELALVQIQQALEISNTIEHEFGRSAEYHVDLANTQFLIGNALLKTGRPNEALEPARRAVEHYQSVVAVVMYFRVGRRLGNALGRLGRAREAEAVYQQAVSAGADTVAVWSQLAAAQLNLGNLAGYRKTCAEMLERFDQRDGWRDPNTVAWYCVLSPETGVDFARVVEVAERALSHYDPHASGTYRRDVLNTVGVALYRAGRYEAAIKRLEESMAEHGKGGTAWDWFFLAMAHGKLGRWDEARPWFDRATTWLDQNESRLKKDMRAVEELRRFRAEAAALLESQLHRNP